MAKIVDYQLFAAAEHETLGFILVVVDDTWVRKLNETVMINTSLAPSELLDHLQNIMWWPPCP